MPKVRNYATHEWHTPQSLVGPNDDLIAFPRAEGGRPGVLEVSDAVVEKMLAHPVMKGWFGPGGLVVEEAPKTEEKAEEKTEEKAE